MSEDLKGSLKGMTLASTNTVPKRKGKPATPVDLEPKDFDNLAQDQGVIVRLIPSVLCPNRTSLTDTNHVLDCPLCFGDEVIDLRCDAKEGFGFIQGINLDKKFEAAGIFDFKDARCTFQSGLRASYMYKVEVPNFSSIYNQLLKKSSGDTDRLRYPPFAACDIPFLMIDSAGIHYTLNQHYKVEDQLIRWLTATRPTAGTLLSLSYPILPTFRVLELLHENRFYYYGRKQAEKHPIQLPQQVVLRWDYLSRKSGTGVTRE